MRRARPPGSQGAGNGAAADERTPPKRTSSGGAGHGGGGSLGGLFAASRLARAPNGRIMAVDVRVYDVTYTRL